MQLCVRITTKRFNRSSLNHWREVFSCSDGRSPEFEKILKGRRGRFGVWSCHANIRTPHVMLRIWRWQHRHMANSSWRHPSNGFLRHITCLHLIFISIPRITRKMQGQMWARHEVTTASFAALGKCFYTLVLNSRSCTQKGCEVRLKWKLQIFLAGRPIDSITMVIVWPLLKTMPVNQRVFKITDRFLELTEAALTARTCSTPIKTILFNNCVMPYGIFSYVLTYKEALSMSDCFTTLCLFLEISLKATHRRMRRLKCTAGP